MRARSAVIWCVFVVCRFRAACRQLFQVPGAAARDQGVLRTDMGQWGCCCTRGCNFESYMRFIWAQRAGIFVCGEGRVRARRSIEGAEDLKNCQRISPNPKGLKPQGVKTRRPASFAREYMRQPPHPPNVVSPCSCMQEAPSISSLMHPPVVPAGLCPALRPPR